ncbi:MAG: 2-oxo acid dehydrogenase subunit E2 [Comamonadaceae bacterium]|nr:MAG: 2-oxo acid dehydrogenase subunit E2 [Comamonadaceae bacterium]
MGHYIIKTPDIGEGIAEVELVAWYVKPGDTVKEDQTLCDVMTDKATVEVPSPKSGVVVSLGGAVGAVVAVGAELVRLEIEGEGNAKEASAAPAAAAKAAPAAKAASAPAPVSSPPVAPPKAESAPAAARASTRPDNADTADSDPRRHSDATPAIAGGRPTASPAVRLAALDRGIELRFVKGSGPAGRILHEDLDAYQAGAAAGQPSGSRYTENRDETNIPVIGLRRKIAQKMQEAKRRIPHFSYVEEVDVTELEATRVRLNARFAKQRGKLTLLPLMARAVVLAVAEFPQMSARYDDDGGSVTRYGGVHLGIATQTDNGLMVPVIRHAEARDVWGCGAEIARLAEAARTGKGSRDELSGSTITISSLGALGGIVTTPVINYPEVAIIGVNKMVERPVVRNGAIVVRQMMNLSASFDHRVIDGMEAAEFIQAVRAYLETPALLFVD